MISVNVSPNTRLGGDKRQSVRDGRVGDTAVGKSCGRSRLGCVPSHGQTELRRLQLGSPENPAQELEEEEDKEEGDKHGRNGLQAA